jgi:hypothetical protein
MAKKRSRTPLRDSDIRRIAEIQRMEVESNQLSGRLANLTELTRQLEATGADPARGIAEMQKRRADLTKSLRTAAKDARFFANINLIKDRRISALINIGDILWPWSTLELPTMQEGVNDTPNTSDSDGEIATAGLFQGAGAFGGMPADWGPKERWWIHNWYCTAVLPPAGNTGGTISYKFGANCEAIVYHVEGTANLSSFITVGTTSDVNVAITNWQTVGWPFFNVALPQPGVPSFGGGVPVIGDIPIAAGKSAAVTVYIGVIVSITNGYVMFLPNSTFSIGLLGQSGYTAVGKIQYRFNPQWVVQGVNEALA